MSLKMVGKLQMTTISMTELIHLVPLSYYMAYQSQTEGTRTRSRTDVTADKRQSISLRTDLSSRFPMTMASV